MTNELTVLAAAVNETNAAWVAEMKRSGRSSVESIAAFEAYKAATAAYSELKKKQPLTTYKHSTRGTRAGRRQYNEQIDQLNANIQGRGRR